MIYLNDYYKKNDFKYVYKYMYFNLLLFILLMFFSSCSSNLYKEATISTTKNTYDGNISITINTGLINKNDNSKMFCYKFTDKNFSLKSNIDFDKKDVIRKKNTLGSDHLTQANNISNYDTNIFDPANINSLKDLSIYEGDVSVGNGITRMSSGQLNNTKFNFENQFIVASFSDDKALNNFKLLYNATIVQNVYGDFYKLKLDLSKSPINRIEDILTKYNNDYPNKQINSATFSSLGALKTFVILLDFYTNYKNDYKTLELDIVPDILSYANVNRPNDLYYQFYGSNLASTLEATHLFDAWKFIKDITGKDIKGDGIKVAVIETTTSFILNHPEMLDKTGSKSRYLLNKGNYQEYTWWPFIDRNDPKKLEECEKIKYADCSDTDMTTYHAHGTTMVGFAKDNNAPYAQTGIAPNAEVIPYRIFSLSDKIVAMGIARNNGADIISLSISIAGENENFFTWLDSIPFTCAVNDLQKSGVIVVQGAPNTVGDDNIKNLSGYANENMITVCSAMIVHDSIDPNIINFQAIHGYGKNVVRAPMNNYVSQPDNSKLSHANALNLFIPTEFTGNSSATPYVSGTIALMKSFLNTFPPEKRSLTTADFRQILLDSAQIKVNPTQDMIKDGFTNEKLIDVYEAVKLMNSKLNPLPLSIKNSAGVDVPVVTNGSKIEVKSGDQIAIPITASIKNQLNNVFIGGIQVTLLEIVQNYAIYGVPNLGASSFTATTSLIDIVIKNNLGQTVETLADALKILLDAITQTKNFPSSITVNGVTTTLDYGFNFDFNEASGNTVFDKSGNNNNATLGGFNGTFPERFSLADGSTGLRFTNEAYLRVPDNNSYEMPNSFTFLSKVKINEINKYQTLLVKGSGVSSLLDSYVWSIDEQNRITLSLFKAGNTNPCTLFTQSDPLYLVTNPLNIQPNETIGLAVSFDQKNKVLKFYKNQTELSYTVAYPIPNSICGNVYDYNRLPDSPLDLYIGSYVYDNGTLHYPDSNLQELYLIANVKNRALNGGEVGKIFYDMGLRD